MNNLDIDRLHYVIENYPVGRGGGNTTARIEEFIGALLLNTSKQYVILMEAYCHLNYLPHMVIERLRAHNIYFHRQSKTRILLGGDNSVILDFIVKDRYYQQNMYGRRCYIIEVDY